MAADVQHALHLLDQLGPGDTMVSFEDGEILSGAERKAVAEADEWLSITGRSLMRKCWRSLA